MMWPAVDAIKQQIPLLDYLQTQARSCNNSGLIALRNLRLPICGLKPAKVVSEGSQPKA